MKTKIISAFVALTAALALSACDFTSAWIAGSNYSCSGSSQRVQPVVTANAPDDVWRITGSNYGQTSTWTVSGASVAGPIVTFSGSSKTFVAYLATSTGDTRTVTMSVTNACD